MLAPCIAEEVKGVFVVTTPDQPFRSESLSQACSTQWECTLSVLPSGEIAHDVKFDMRLSLHHRMVTTAFLNVFSKIAAHPPGWYLVFEDDAIVHPALNYLSPPFAYPDDAYMINIQKDGGFFWCNRPSTKSPWLSSYGEQSKCTGGFGVVGFYVSQHGATEINYLLRTENNMIDPVDNLIYNQLRDHVYQSRSTMRGNVYVTHAKLPNDMLDKNGKKYHLQVESQSKRCLEYYDRKMCIELPRLLMYTRIYQTLGYAFHSSFDTTGNNVKQIGVYNNACAEVFKDGAMSAEEVFHRLVHFNCVSA